MMAQMMASSFGFAPTIRMHSVGQRAAPPLMVANPLDAVASPLRKFDAPDGLGQGSPLDDLPVEVILLFGAIIVVGILGLVKQSGALSETAPTVSIGETRDDLADEAAKAEAEMSQGEKEKKYFAVLAQEQATKRGGSKSKRKSKKK